MYPIRTGISLLILLVAISTTFAQSRRINNDFVKPVGQKETGLPIELSSLGSGSSNSQSNIDQLTQKFRRALEKANNVRDLAQDDMIMVIVNGTSGDPTMRTSNASYFDKEATVVRGGEKEGEPCCGANYRCQSACDWSGFYAGGHIGYGWDFASVDVTDTIAFFGPFSATAQPNDWVGGGQLGFWRQPCHNIVWGMDVSLSGTNISETNTTGIAVDSFDVDIRSITMIQGRLGMTCNDWLFYTQFGYAGVDGQASITDNVPVNFDTDGQWHNGWTIGIGASKRIRPRFSIGTEYNYIGTGSEIYNWSDGVVFDSQANIDHELHILKFTGTVHF